ncbi:putative multicopper oxidases [Candidatus Brocadia sinica JPN1]|uniref:Multicopper oxidases n=1 Tax=Candidatus Brocadia sinica JPN1 TaxID=1197129 RepID=A0ABQ0JZX9_9BACT|nr:putative multicopper oxidases [Candidatus Brocadia sinica JPN1]
MVLLDALCFIQPIQLNAIDQAFNLKVCTKMKTYEKSLQKRDNVL